MNSTPAESTPSTKPIENTSIPSNSTPLDPPKSKLPFIITGIILVSLIGTGVYFLDKTQNNPTPATPIITSPTSATSVPSSVPPADPTADWKTYTSSKYNYTLRYPPEVTIEELAASSPKSCLAGRTPECIIYEGLSTTQFMISQEWLLSITVNKKSIEKSIQDVTEYYKLDAFSATTTQVKKYSDYLQGYEYTASEQGGPGTHIYFWGSLNNSQDKILHIEWIDVQFAVNRNDKKKIIDQILSTFKFLDEKDKLSCQTDSDCDVELCGCKAKNKNFIDKSKNICTVMCGTPTCTNNKCLVQPYKGY